MPSVRIVGTYPNGPARHSQIHDVTLASRGASSHAFAAARGARPVSGSSQDIQGPYEVAPRHAETLTRREFQVLALISAGMTTVQIAGRLGISAKTVEGKRQTLYSKLGVQNQSSAVAVAMRTGYSGRPSGALPDMTWPRSAQADSGVQETEHESVV